MNRPLVVILLLFSFLSQAQKPKQYHSGEVRQLLKKLNVLGSVLYVAAHPDDENTSLIAYYANEELYRTAYLSATRGDGGQNLIGPEIREGLGVIRTQELLAARKTDGGQQFFSRANDFGYSKHPDETLMIWEKEKVLSDFVRVIRKFRPDIIITRFNKIPGGNHGHHTSSAILAHEAFKLANDPNAFPEQLETLELWQPKKIFWNNYYAFFRRGGNNQEFDTTGLQTLDIGTYNQDLGLAYTEISAFSRSMHKSQGFGSTGRRGSTTEYLEQWDGEVTSTAFGGIDTSWGRVDGAGKVSEFLRQASEKFSSDVPEVTLKYLFQAREELLKLSDSFWKDVKLGEIEEAVKSLTGLYLEIVADDHSYVPGDSIKLAVEAITRIDGNLVLSEITIPNISFKNSYDLALGANRKITTDLRGVVKKDLTPNGPYWLNDKATLGMYHVDDTEKIGSPENSAVFEARVGMKWEDQYIEFMVPVSYKINDPVKGEFYRPIVITPPMMVNFNTNILIFSDDTQKTFEARFIAGADQVTSKLDFDIPEGWSVEPETLEVSLATKGEERVVPFTITPSKAASVTKISARLTFQDGNSSDLGKNVISYDHFPIQTLFPKTNMKLVKLDLRKSGNLIGYIKGAGDAVPQNLEQIGYQVDFLGKDDVNSTNLAKYDAVILGIRAFNTVDWMSFKNKELFEYSKNGGTVIVQYNTSRRIVTEEIAPYSLKLSRDRVSVENAAVRILEADHPVLNFPNKITQADFDGWVQERGLYFPDEWDENFKAIISSNDPGETPKDGGLLVAKYGEGYYIYSGISWFRELPAGVPGAYRLFTNLISIGNQDK